MKIVLCVSLEYMLLMLSLAVAIPIPESDKSISSTRAAMHAALGVLLFLFFVVMHDVNIGRKKKIIAYPMYGIIFGLAVFAIHTSAKY